MYGLNDITNPASLKRTRDINETLSAMPLPQLQQYAAMHKNDPIVVSLAVDIANKKKQAAMAGAGAIAQQPKVVDQAIAGIAPRPVQHPVQMAAMQLPEETGIGALEAPNMETIGKAAGGIVAFDKGGSTGWGNAFDKAFANVLRYEGGMTRDTGGLTKYGISARANPDIDVANLTIDDAKRLYKKRYWDQIKIGRAHV